MRPILCLDFDGVLHSYVSGWEGADVISDPPVPGAMQFVAAAIRVFDVQIHSSRSHQEGGIAAMREWVRRHLFSEVGDAEDVDLICGRIKFPEHKPPALVSIDDRAITFEGTFPAPETLLAFKPWNRRGV